MQVALICAAVFATTATSSDCGLAGASKVGVVGDSVVLLTPDGWFVSDDGGVVWRPDDFGEQFWPDDVELSDGLDPEQCVGEPRCVRTRRLPTGDGETLLVESEQDGDRVPILAIEASDQRALIELLEPEASACSPVGDGSAVAVELADGDHTIVAMGEAGVLHQAPSGGWEWVAVGDYGFRPRQVAEEPFGIEVRSTLSSDTISRLVSPVVPLVVVLSPVVLLWWARRIARIAERNKRSAPGAAGTSIGVGIVLIVIGLGVVLLAGGFGNDVPPSIAAIWIAIIGSVVLGTWLYHRRPNQAIEAPAFPPPPRDERVG